MTRRRGLGVAAVVLSALAACAGGGESRPPGDTAARTSAAASPSPSVRQTDQNGFPLPERPDCAADAGGTFVREVTSDGNAVGLLLLGSGSGGVVLGPQSNGDICQWLPYAEELAATYRVALFDWKEPRSEVPVLAVAALRAAGADRVVLGGASLGGAFALSEAHAVRPRPAGVLSFGGELTLPGFDGRPGIRRWRGPLLQVSSTHDPYFGNREARLLRRLHPGPETVLMLPGRRHGVDLLDGPDRAQVKETVARFLRRVLG